MIKSKAFLSRTCLFKESSKPMSTKLDTVKMSYTSYESAVDGGQKPPIIIMHGLFGCKTNWNSLAKSLHNMTHRKVITVDARNHGDSPHTLEQTYPSMAEDVKFLMEDLGVKKASLIGHSMGGRTMMYFAVIYVCSNKLLAELTMYRDQAGETSRTLAEARDQLAKASETEDVLKRCAANLTVLAEADRTRRDCEEAKLRTTAKRLTAELGGARCEADRLRTAVVTGCKPAPVSCNGQGLREDNFRLQAELEANFAVMCTLRERVVQLETALQQTCVPTKCV